jgi:hypothetical protein
MSESKHTFRPLRSAAAFFLIAFSTAFLFSIGVRLTGWFTHAPQLQPKDLTVLGFSIMLAVTCLAIGAGVRRMSRAELQSALLGASAILMSTPLAQAVLTDQWALSTAAVSGLGMVTFVLGVLVAMSRRTEEEE